MAKEVKVKKSKVKIAEPVPVEEVGVEAPVKVDAPVKKEFPKKEVNPVCYIVAFQVEGRKGWRYSGFETKELFDAYLAHPGQKNHPKVLSRKWFVFNRVNGTLTEEK